MRFLKSKIFGYTVSLVFLYLTFRKTDFGLILDNFQYVNMYLIVGALLLDGIYLAVRGRYQNNNLQYIAPGLTWPASTISVSIALFYNIIFPARIGDLLRVVHIAKKTTTAKGSVLSYVFIEKIIDLSVVLLLLLFIVVVGFDHTALNKALLTMCVALLALAMGVVLFIKFNQQIVGRIISMVPKKYAALIAVQNAGFVGSFKLFKTRKQVVQGVVLLTIGWAVMMGIFWCVSFPFVKLLDLPPYSFVFFTVFSALSLSLPSAPAGIGVVHYGFFLAVQLLNPQSADHNINAVAAFVIIMHFFCTIVDFVASGSIILFSRFFLKDRINLFSNETGRL